jgi:hypothetical protein
VILGSQNKIRNFHIGNYFLCLSRRSKVELLIRSEVKSTHDDINNHRRGTDKSLKTKLTLYDNFVCTPITYIMLLHALCIILRNYSYTVSQICEKRLLYSCVSVCLSVRLSFHMETTRLSLEGFP